MGCCSSSEAGADRKSAGNGGNSAGASKDVSKGVMKEVSVGNNLSLNSKEGHPLDKYDVLDTLGTGGFAIVKRVRDKFTSESYAMKIISVTIDENPDKVGFMERGGGVEGTEGRGAVALERNNFFPIIFARDTQRKTWRGRRERPLAP